MAEAATQVGRAAHLPEQPRQAFGARGRIGGQQRAELLGQVQQDRAGLEHTDRLRAAAVQQCRNLRVRVHRDEATAELLAFADADHPGVVLRAAVAQRQQLLQHHGHLHAVRGGQRIQLQRMLANRQVFVVRGPCHRAVDAGEPAATGLVPDPDLRRHVVGLVAHALVPRCAGQSSSLIRGTGAARGTLDPGAGRDGRGPPRLRTRLAGRSRYSGASSRCRRCRPRSSSPSRRRRAASAVPAPRRARCRLRAGSDGRCC